MTKWEYSHTKARFPEELSKSAAAMGNEGWELVGVVVFEDQVHGFFKRPQIDESARLHLDDVIATPEDDRDLTPAEQAELPDELREICDTMDDLNQRPNDD